MPFLEQVNPQQKEAIKTVQGPVMVIAGPGSGKTRVLTFRITYLISIGVPAYQILALTFTNKAANEMKGRIAGLVGEKSKQLWMGTFHSVFARLLRSECAKLGYQNNFSIYDALDSLGLIKTIMKEMGIPMQQFSPQAVRSRISSAKNRLVMPDEYAGKAVDAFGEKTAGIYSVYQKRLKLNNAMDFDDLLLKPIELFTHHKAILSKYQERFRFILIDEYQDTNRAQYVLIKLLAEKYKNICVVGDDAQSIYAFRGADIRNILDFEQDYPEAKIIRLEQNYRSTRTILSAADQVIKKNVDQISKTLWTENLEGEKITVLPCEDDRNEGETVALRISEEMHRLKLDFGDFAIMYRTNAQSRSLEDALRRFSIPYIIVGGVEFYQRKEVKDVLAYLKLLVNPRDEESFLRIVNFPPRGLGGAAVGSLKVFAAANSLSLHDAAARASEIGELHPKARKSLEALSLMLEKYRRLEGEMSAGERSRALVDEIGILQMFKEEGTQEALTRRENVQELLGAISEFAEQHPGSTLENFLQDVSLVSDLDTWDDKSNAVTLMTLHSAKGLEFPVVFITGLEEGLLPFYSAVSIDRKDLEEERRLCYVGMTRAMKKLYLSYAVSRFRFNDKSYHPPSRFLDEISPEMIEVPAVRRKVPEFQSKRGSRTNRAPGKGMREGPGADSHYFTDSFPDYEKEMPAGYKLRAGVLVEHEIFGRGKVIYISGKGDSLKAVVEFRSAGRKNLMVKYARLKIV